MALTVIQHGDMDEPGLRQAWGELSRRSPNAGLFTSYEWCRCWARTVGRNVPPAILRVIDPAARTVGLLPLCIDANGSARWLGFMGRERTSGDHLAYSACRVKRMIAWRRFSTTSNVRRIRMTA